ncbi:MAG: hypothetical protein QXT45_02420, partial [Candidatus Bilamarchaeaceae archaeon]
TLESYANENRKRPEEALPDLLNDENYAKNMWDFDHQRDIAARAAHDLPTDKETVDKQRADALAEVSRIAYQSGVSSDVIKGVALELAKDNKYIWDAVKDLLSSAVKDVAEKIGAMRAEETIKEAMAKELERLKKLLKAFINEKTVDRIITILTDEKFKLEERKQKTQTKAPSKEKKEIDSLIETELKRMSEAQTFKNPLAAMVPRRIG